MFSCIWSALRARRAAMLEAEALVYRFGSRGVEMAQTYSGDDSVSEERREHYRRVARIAEARHLGIKGLDIATQYYEIARWQRRRGNLIGGGHWPIPFKRGRRRYARGLSPHNIGTAVAVVALAACAGYANLPGDTVGAAADRAGTFTGRVTRVVDGDTFWISSASERIRVWGLDAAEVGTPGGSEATAALTALISGQQLTCRQRDIDRYGRIVGQCFLPDGRDITAVMIDSGTAEEFCRYSGNHYRTC